MQYNRFVDQLIKKIEVITLVRRLDQEFRGSTYRVVSRNTLFVRVETNDGILGEAFGGDEDIHQEKVVEIANEFPLERLWDSTLSMVQLPLHSRGIHTLDLINRAILMQRSPSLT